MDTLHSPPHAGQFSAGRVVVLGAAGVAGKLHLGIWNSLSNLAVFAVDPTAGLVIPQNFQWDDAIVDVCTPTATHDESMVEAYAKGARRFIVEKPAAASEAAWNGLLARLPGARIACVHQYLWSVAFRTARDLAGPVATFASAFDKQRAADDQRGRGAHACALAHTLQVEAPHQFAMALAVEPDLNVERTLITRRGLRGTDPTAATAAIVDLSAGPVRARIGSDLRAPKRRTLSLRNQNGVEIEARFASSTLEAAVYADAGRGQRLVWEGVDDALRENLTAALSALSTDSALPDELSARFAGRVLNRIDHAIAVAVDEDVVQVA